MAKAKTKKAKPKPAAKKAQAVEPRPAEPQLLALAKKGDVEGIYVALEALGDDSERDLEIYKWLAVAADYGSEEADSALDDMLEVSSLRYDDDHGAQGGVHFDLGVAYLQGTQGIPLDVEKGRAHLVQARRCEFPEQIQGAAKLLADTRKDLPATSLAVFDAVYNGKPLPDDDDEDDDDDDDEEDFA